MKKTFEYDLTKYDPSAPKKTEEFLTADGVKTLTTDANDGAVLIQDEVDEDSLNPVTGAAVAAAIEAGGGGTEYSAGDGISIAEDTISAKVDGTTIGVNASGELEALGGGSSYTAGAGIAIDGNGTISVVPDNTTVKVERPQAVYATKDSFFGTMSFSDTQLGTATSSSTCTFSYGLDTNGAAFKIGCDSDQIGCEIRVEIGNDSSFTKSVISTVGMAKSNQTGVLVTLTDTATVLEGYGLSFYRGWGSPAPTFSNSFDWSEYTFDEIFANSSIYVRLRAWNSVSGALVGNPLTNPTSSGTTPYVSANMSINSDAVPLQVMVVNPLPDSSGASQGDVLSIGSNGPEWAAAGGGSGGRTSVVRNVSSLTRSGTTWTGTFLYDFPSQNLPDMVAVHVADSCVGASGADTQKFKLGLNYTNGNGDQVFWLQPAFVEPSNGWCLMHGTVSTINLTPIINDGATGFTGFTMVAPFTPSSDYVSDVKVEFFFPAN